MKKIILFLISIIFVWFSLKLINFYKLQKDFSYIESSSLGKYMELFFLKKNRIPENIEDLIFFIKKRDELLFEKMKNMEIRYVRNNKDIYSIYHDGFDGKDDLLKKEYNLRYINFFKSFSIKGDAEFDFFYNFKMKYDRIYKVSKDSLIYFKRLSFLDVCKNYYECDRIRFKLDDNHFGRNNLRVRIEKKDSEYGNSNFSKETLIAIDKLLKKKLDSLNFNDVYILNLSESNIEQFECMGNS